MGQVVVMIGGRPYRMACEDGEEDRLGGLGRALDEKLSQMKATFGEIGDQRLTVMAALAIADELEEARNRLARAMAEMETARLSALGDLERAQLRDAELAVAIDLASERIERLTQEMGEASRET